MKAGADINDCHFCTFNMQFSGEMETAVNVTNSTNLFLPSFHADIKHPNATDVVRSQKIGRNESCPCGSGIKYKKCHGATQMTTGIRSKNSELKIGTANIVADVGVDLVDSKASIEVYNFYSTQTPALAEILKNLPAQPPVELVKEALAQLKAGASAEDLESSKLKKWFKDQGINMAFWANFAVSLASIGLSVHG